MDQHNEHMFIYERGQKARSTRIQIDQHSWNELWLTKFCMNHNLGKEAQDDLREWVIQVNLINECTICSCTNALLCYRNVPIQTVTGGSPRLVLCMIGSERTALIPMCRPTNLVKCIRSVMFLTISMGRKVTRSHLGVQTSWRYIAVLLSLLLLLLLSSLFCVGHCFAVKTKHTSWREWGEPSLAPRSGAERKRGSCVYTRFIKW